MQVGRFFVYLCDFCQARHEQRGYGLPDGMCWLPGSYLLGTGTRHICKKCQDEGRHGKEKPRKSGTFR